MINIKKNIDCMGCTACQSICPKECIIMKEDHEGFRYPHIENNLCINCHLCEKVCPVMNDIVIKNNVKVYAIKNKNEEERLISTSGGFFSVLSNYVLENNGYVCGAAYDNYFNVVHTIIHNKDELYKLRGAKYSQSDLKDIFVQVKSLLENNKLVLFSGTPCQISGLKSYLNKQYKKLITVDLICHGVPSPKIWNYYVQYRSDIDNNGILPKAINLRSKETGWSRYNYCIKFQYEEKEYQEKNNNDIFMIGFVNDLFLRPSCYHCKFKGINRISDFTLGDYWGIWDQQPDFDDNKGVSLVFFQSKKSFALFDLLKDRVNYIEVDEKKSIINNNSMINSAKNHNKREIFMQYCNEKNINDMINKSLYENVNKTSFMNKLINKLLKK